MVYRVLLCATARVKVLKFIINIVELVSSA